ncbi:hypothetical protein L484_010421 [Morus notabilis]|uniref:Ig-like domain-containing protein n=1 Tax=Morus notabilis TaxID=981085 RepID=W9RD87_9ROSA|nr:hypothetical protein L484_010421 [Morus notabilis]
MAPTAAMLILSHSSKASSGSTPSLPCATASSGAKVSILKWVSEHNPIAFNPRKPDHNRESCVEVDHDALEKRFQEALELSCW